MHIRILRLLVVTGVLALALNMVPSETGDLAASLIEWRGPIKRLPLLQPVNAGTPQRIQLEIVPDTLIANSGATAVMTATVFDEADLPVPNVQLSGIITPAELGALSSLNVTNDNGQSVGAWTAGTVVGSGALEVGNGVISGTATISLTAGALTTITLAPPATSVAAGTVYTFTASGADQHDNSVAITPTWSTNGGTIDSGGVFTAQTTIADGRLISAADNSIVGTASVDITAGDLVSLTVSPDPADIVVGTTQVFTATGYDVFNNGAPITPAWSTNAGTIDAAGLLTAQTLADMGRVVTATSGTVTATATVNILAGSLDSIGVSPTSINMAAGTSWPFIPSGSDQYGNIVAITPTWSTNGGTIDSSGVFTAQTTVASGKLVTATQAAISNSASVNVIAGPLQQIMVSPGSVTLTVATTQTFSASGFDQFDNSVPITPTWSTDGGLVSADGLYTAQTIVASGKRVTATHNITSSSALVQLQPAAPYTLTLQPATAVISAGQRITFTSLTTDTFGNYIGNVTGSTSFSISPEAGGSFAANVVTPTVKNTWIVTGVTGSAVGTTPLVVTAAAFNRLAIENTPAGSGNPISNVSLSVYDTLPAHGAAYDVYNNLIGARSVTWGGTGVVAGRLAPTSGTSTTFTPNISGTGTITAASGIITGTTGTITVQAPELVISKTASPSPVTPGDSLQYTIIYTNVGNAPAQNTIITETYPPGLTFLGAFPPPTANNNVWSVGTLAEKDQGSITIFMLTPSQMPVGSVLTNSVRISADEAATAFYTTTTTVNALPDLSVSVSDEPDDPVRPGAMLDYTIQYRNDGSAPVTYVRITETYPTGVSFVSASPAPNVSNNVWLTDTLNGNGANRTINVRVRVNLPLTDTTILTNRVVVDAQEAPPYTTTEQTLVTAPWLQLDSFAVPATPKANNLLTYTLRYTNTGSSYAANTVITDIVPVNTSFVQCQPAGCQVNGSLVSRNLGQLDPQTSGLLTMTVLVNNNLPNGTVVTNTARIYSTDLVTDTTVLTRAISSAADVTLSKTDNRTTIAAGELTTYTLSYANIGTAPAHNVVITDRLPANTTFSSCTSCTAVGGGVYSFTLGTINAGGSGSRTFSVRVAGTLPAGLRVITNTAAIATSSGGNPVGNDFAQDVNTLSTQPALDLGAIYDARTPYPGKIVTYTLRYTNTSAMDTTGVVMTITWPAWLSAPPSGWTRSDGFDQKTIGNLAAGQSGSVNYVVTLPQTYTLAMNAFTLTFHMKDGGPGGLPPAYAQRVTFIGVPDLIIEDVGVPSKVPPGVPFTATVTIRNLGLGRACNPNHPTNCLGFYISVFVDPPAPPLSYPFESYGPFAPVPVVGGLASEQTATYFVRNIVIGAAQDPVLYFKVDNYNCSATDCLPPNSKGGLVPEYNEFNNVSDPVYVTDFKLYLPLIRKT